MPFIGNQLSTSFQNVETQTITGDGSTSYTLNNAVADGKDLLVYINNVKQEEGSGKSYTATGTTITFTEAVASTDSCYVVFIGQAVGTVTPKDGSIVSSMLADANLEMPNTLDLNGKEFFLDADADTSITADTDDRVDIKIAGTDKIHITSTGLGIGTTSPSADLGVNGRVTLGDQAGSGTAGAGSMIVGASSLFIQASEHKDSSTRVPIVFSNIGGSAESMRIDSSGRLLVGSTSVTAVPVATTNRNPQAEIVGSLSGSNHHGSLSLRCTNDGAVLYLSSALTSGNRTAGSLCFLLNDGTDYHAGAKIECQNDDTTANNDTPGRLTFSTTEDCASSPTERMRIHSSGNVSVGVTSITSGGFSANTRMVIQSAGSGGETLGIRTTQSSGTSLELVVFRDGDDTQIGTIVGNASANTTSYGTSSDYRLKENVVNVDKPIEKLKKLKPKTFNMISDPDNKLDGFLAHELGEVIPNAAHGVKDAVNEDGSIKPQQVDYGLITPLLTAALQEAVAKIETLEAKVATLESK